MPTAPCPGPCTLCAVQGKPEAKMKTQQLRDSSAALRAGSQQSSHVTSGCSGPFFVLFTWHWHKSGVKGSKCLAEGLIFTW